MNDKFFGKYRATVTANRDPEQMGRIRVQVPAVPGNGESPWALPCVFPGTSKKLGSALPQVGTGVWVEFEQGDLSHPIWTGPFYGSTSETPPSLRNPP